VIVVFGLILAGAIFGITGDGTLVVLPFAAIFVLIFLGVLLSLRAKTIISDDEISSQSIFGMKSMRWTEIHRVSGSGHRIKLHNFDGDVTVAPSSQLPGFPEVVDSIGAKRPDLFNPLDYREMKKDWTSWVSLVVLVLLFMGMLLGFGISFINTPQELDSLFMPLIIIVVVFLAFIGSILFSPQSLTLEGRSMRIKYLFNEKALSADEIVSVELRFTQTRNGKNYFILLNLSNRKSMRLSGLGPSLPIAYLVLKNWQRNNSGTGIKFAD
jgi:hypothetical protein